MNRLLIVLLLIVYVGSSQFFGIFTHDPALTVYLPGALAFAVAVLWNEITTWQNRNRYLPGYWIVDIRYPDAFDIVLRILKTSYRGASGWQIALADPETGYIQARMQFREDLTGDITAVQRQVVIDVHLTPVEGDKTRVQPEYDVYSEYNANACNQIVDATTYSISDAFGTDITRTSAKLKFDKEMVWVAIAPVAISIALAIFMPHKIEDSNFLQPPMPPQIDF